MPEDQTQKNNPTNRLCDNCNNSTALLYCRADSAKLCLSCDNQVHSTNLLFTKHTRWRLCDVCDSAPALIFCFSDGKLLCQNCDFETHRGVRNPLVVHEHRALEGFDGCPCVGELAGFVGFEEFDPKGKCCEGEGGDVVDEFLVWDPSQRLMSMEELVVATDLGHNFQALGVPPLPKVKNKNVACGKHKEEILRQLCQLAKAEDNANLQGELLAIDQFLLDEFDYGVQEVHEILNHVPEPVAFAGDEVNSYPWSTDEFDAANEFLLSSTLLDSYIDEGSSAVGNDSQEQGASVTEASDTPQETPVDEYSSVDRNAALSRYKEKKRTRRYDKHIRYESRKVLAEGRIRIKGRFAKVCLLPYPVQSNLVTQY
ncbi:hypothetical protein Droror1_Dr00008489 [Drosera rotundifolia]